MSINQLADINMTWADNCDSLREASFVYVGYKIGQNSLTLHVTVKALKVTFWGFNHSQLG